MVTTYFQTNEDTAQKLAFFFFFFFLDNCIETTNTLEVKQFPQENREVFVVKK